MNSILLVLYLIGPARVICTVATATGNYDEIYDYPLENRFQLAVPRPYACLVKWGEVVSFQVKEL